MIFCIFLPIQSHPQKMTNSSLCRGRNIVICTKGVTESKNNYRIKKLWIRAFEQPGFHEHSWRRPKTHWKVTVFRCNFHIFLLHKAKNLCPPEKGLSSTVIEVGKWLCWSHWCELMSCEYTLIYETIPGEGFLWISEGLFVQPVTALYKSVSMWVSAKIRLHVH